MGNIYPQKARKKKKREEEEAKN
uniref:Uncharacterized protein n=1 Tax=Rhizophora mucronata TaxID=61149 RepID=A0A2P2IKE2_RHIMU